VTPFDGVHVAPPVALLKAALFGSRWTAFDDVVSHTEPVVPRRSVAAAIDRDAGGVILLGAADRQAEHDVGGARFSLKRNASRLPCPCSISPKVVVDGRFVARVVPVTYANPWTSTAIPAGSVAAFDRERSKDERRTRCVQRATKAVVNDRCNRRR